MQLSLPISDLTWKRLREANQAAVTAGWAQSGVFATGVGPEYAPGELGSLLYIGKSAGPLGNAVGSCDDQLVSGRASAKWMIDRQNKSAFWQFVDQIDRTRRTIAWTNLCKMDRIGGETPPSDRQWAQIAEPCIDAIADEMSALMPQVAVFATSGLYQADVDKLLARLGYQAIPLPFHDGRTTCRRFPRGNFVIQTKHPHGWAKADRDRVIDLTKSLMRGDTTGLEQSNRSTRCA
jgi:hypothetical protein